jgi:DNA-binding NarL/FixJ family response regulator
MAVDSRKRIVLIDDHTLLREGLERLLSAGDEFVICEEAGSAAEGIELVREIRPDGVILDVELPGGSNGIELAKQLWGEFPEMVVLILSAHEEPEYAERAAEAGAMGYILKSEAAENLRTALRNAFRGRRTFPGNLAPKDETRQSRAAS